MLFNFFKRKQKNQALSSDIPALYLFNTLSKEKELFVPLKPNYVGMYSCGPTVYEYQHIGNMRPYIWVDILKRILRSDGYTIKHVINITDVGHLESDADDGEDKVEKSARLQGLRTRELTEKVTKSFLEDLRRLNVSVIHTEFPRAIAHVDEQIAFIKTLEEKGYTYQITDGIYFDTSLFPTYGKLGNIQLKELKEGVRVDKNAEKRNPTDFALWKFSPKDTVREQEWHSPWGLGFPGWHIECSAMSMKYLGRQFDIHTGGIDHVPIHHNNEIAQGESVTGKPVVRYWLHNAFIKIEGRKISKSIGNTVYIRNIIDRGFSPLAYRYWLLQARYRTPVDFTWEALEASHNALFKLHKLFAEKFSKLPESPKGAVVEKYMQPFLQALHDDIDTPQALALLWDMLKDASIENTDKRKTLLAMDQLLGLDLIERNTSVENSLSEALPESEIPHEVQELLSSRREARKKGNWQEADRVRDQLKKMGFELIDTENKTQVFSHSRVLK